MKQKSFATTGFELIAKRTRKREFLDEMNLVVPWTELEGLIEPYAPSAKTGRRTPYEVQHILGHTQVRTTQRYAHLSQDILLDAANAANLGSNLIKALA